jgi:alanyl-tRNA synthetase
MDEQKARARSAQKKEVIKIEHFAELKNTRPTVFTGFDELETASIIEFQYLQSFVSTETPFYAEMGGQVGDTGTAEVDGRSFKIYNTIRSGAEGLICHQLGMEGPAFLSSGQVVILHVDEFRRSKIEAHHSGTHLLNWALRKVLGNTVSQKGSYVGPDRLRFDFSHGAALTPEELAEVERLVNEKIEADVAVKWEERPYAEVKGDPSILQFFGDKYGDTVRVVSIGDFSRELCGGTHVRQSGKVGYFKILHEAAIAAGIRRIEAASGIALWKHLKEHVISKQDEQYSALRLRNSNLPENLSDLILKTEPFADYAKSKLRGDLSERVLWQYCEARNAALHEATTGVAQHEKDEAKRREAAFQKSAAEDAPKLIASAQTISDVPFLAQAFTDAPAAYLPVLADAIKMRWQGVAVLAAVDQGKVALLAAVAPAFTKKIQAGKIIQAIAPLVGGKGGGRPELAQGGGNNPDGVAAALAKAADLLRAL